MGEKIREKYVPTDKYAKHTRKSRVIYDTSPAQACVFLAEGVILEKCTWLVSTACIFDVFVARRASFGLVFFGLVWFVCFLYFFCKQLISLPPTSPGCWRSQDQAALGRVFGERQGKHIDVFAVEGFL